jgi:hypothetical protein
VAIKSKSKGRSKGKQVSRAPRRAPVAVPTPFLARRWVQVVGGFLVGLFAMSVFVWLMNGLRSNDAESSATGAAADKRTAATAYQTMVQGAFGSLGTLNPGLPPAPFPEMQQALTQMAQGKNPQGAEEVFGQAAKDAKTAAATVTGYNVSTTIADKGFDQLEAAAFTSSAEGLVLALQLYQQCADVARVAAARADAPSSDLTDVATGLCSSAQAQLNQAWTDYLAALRAGGVSEAPAGLVPELPGGGT